MFTSDKFCHIPSTSGKGASNEATNRWNMTVLPDLAHFSNFLVSALFTFLYLRSAENYLVSRERKTYIEAPTHSELITDFRVCTSSLLLHRIYFKLLVCRPKLGQTALSQAGVFLQKCSDLKKFEEMIDQSYNKDFHRKTQFSRKKIVIGDLAEEYNQVALAIYEFEKRKNDKIITRQVRPHQESNARKPIKTDLDT